MPPIAGEWPHLTGPTPRFGSFRPFLAHQDMRTVDLIERAIMWAVLCNALFFAANAHDKRLTLHTRRRMHARHLQEIGHMFGVVDVVKERLLIGIYIHRDDKQISGFDRHWTVPSLWFFATLRRFAGSRFISCNIAPGLIMTDRLIAILTARAKGLGITVDEQPASAAHGA